jgi:hypothetical protein
MVRIAVLGCGTMGLKIAGSLVQQHCVISVDNVSLFSFFLSLIRLQVTSPISVML